MIITDEQHGIFDPNNFHLPIHIVGNGGVGSHVATGLVRMGLGIRHPIHLYDYDLYELKNLRNQAINLEAVSQEKVYGLEQQLRNIEPELAIHTHKVTVTDSTAFGGIVFLCLDSTDASSAIVDSCLEENRQVKCVIETRMDAETGISHCFNPNNPRHMDCWWMYWYPDAHTENTPGCGGPKSIISAVYGTVAIALKQFELFARRKRRSAVFNRIYTDFSHPEHTRAERWDTSWHP